MNSRSHARSRTLLAVLVASAGLVAAPIAAAASTLPSASSVISLAKGAMTKVSGVHLTSSSTTSGTKLFVVADVGTSSGTEVYTSGTQRIEIKVTPASAYLRGSVTGLTKLMGMTPAQIKRVGTRWIAIASSSSVYGNFKSNLTVAGFSGLLPAATGAVVSRTSSSAFRLTWARKATKTTTQATTILTLTSSPRVLPTKEWVSSSSGTSTTLFTKWGEHVSVTAPVASTTIAYSKVFTG